MGEKTHLGKIQLRSISNPESEKVKRWETFAREFPVREIRQPFPRIFLIKNKSGLTVVAELLKGS